ncbi:MAG: sigma-70 family RNA polymerase sigma factor [Planctomycetota bacterium]
MRDNGTHDAEGLLGRIESVRALARRLVQDASAADDAIQDVLVAALQRPRGSELPSTNWFRRALLNRVLDDWRSSSRRRERERRAARGEADSPEDPAELAERHRHLATAALELPEPYRTVILLRYFEDRTPREIAARTDRSIPAVKKQLQRGLDQLRLRLRDEYGDERRWVLALASIANVGGSRGKAAQQHVALQSSLAWVPPLCGGAALAVLAALAVEHVAAPTAPATRIEPFVPEPTPSRDRAPDGLAIVGAEPSVRTVRWVPSVPSADRIEVRARIVDERGTPIEGATARWLEDATIEGGTSDVDGALVVARDRRSG